MQTQDRWDIPWRARAIRTASHAAALAALVALAACGGSSAEDASAASSGASSASPAAGAGEAAAGGERAQALATSVWARCASEGQTCTVPGTRTVRYGANGAYVTRTVTNSVACTNSVFGDPAVGIVKTCEYDSANDGSTTTTGSTTSTPAGWTFLANEWEAFSVSGTQTVRYGAGNSWITRTLSGSGKCSNTFFGNDPLVGTIKHCERATTTTTSTTTTTTTTSGGSTSTSWRWMANENQSFTLSSATTVRYGAGSSWVTRTMTGTVLCGNGTFGDPIVGTVKHCEAAGSVTTSTSTAGSALLSWSASGDSRVTGYRVHWGTAPGSYGSSVNTGNVTSYTVQGLTSGRTYYFAVTSLDASGNQSSFSGEASKTIP